MSENRKEYIEVEGIKCEIKDPSKKGITEYYQLNLRLEVDKYESSIDRWTDSKTGYLEALRANVRLAPFVLGWLRPPENEDEYLVIKGYMTQKELDLKLRKAARKTKKPLPAKGGVKKISVPKKKETKEDAPKLAPKEKLVVLKKPSTPKKPAAPKKPSAPKKPVAPKKPTVKSLNKK